MDKPHHITALIDYLKLNVSKFEREVGAGASTISKAIDRNTTLGFGTIRKILDKYPNVNKEWLETGEGKMLLSEPAKAVRSPFRDAVDLGAWDEEDAKEVHRGKEFIDLGNGKYLLYTPLVPHTASMGYLKGYSDPEWLQELPQHAITVDKIPFGTYRTFIARGDSMRDGTERSILPNSKVTGRVIRQDLYRDSKLHLHKFQLFVIVHKEGITIKEITNHDVEKGLITIHSWNPDKKEYPDMELELKDVLQLLNVIKIERDL